MFSNELTYRMLFVSLLRYIIQLASSFFLSICRKSEIPSSFFHFVPPNEEELSSFFPGSAYHLSISLSSFTNVRALCRIYARLSRGDICFPWGMIEASRHHNASQALGCPIERIVDSDACTQQRDRNSRIGCYDVREMGNSTATMLHDFVFVRISSRDRFLGILKRPVSSFDISICRSFLSRYFKLPTL